jgi:hypothetical protein
LELVISHMNRIYTRLSYLKSVFLILFSHYAYISLYRLPARQISYTAEWLNSVAAERQSYDLLCYMRDSPQNRVTDLLTNHPTNQPTNHPPTQPTKSSSVLLWLEFLSFNWRFAGSNPSEGEWFFREIRIRSTPSSRGEVKPSAPCRKIVLHVKEPYKIWKRDFIG